MENYYEILHIANFAEIEIVKVAYKAMTKLYHPDINHKVDSSVMVGINLAYEVLGNPTSKKEYDLKLRQFLDSIRNETKNEYSEPSKPKNETKQKREPRRPQNRVEKAAWAVGGVLWSAAEGFMEGLEEFREEAENAYLKGCEYNDFTLVRYYLKSTGSKKQGYSKALLERGLLYKENGEIVPTYDFKQIAKYL